MIQKVILCDSCWHTCVSTFVSLISVTALTCVLWKVLAFVLIGILSLTVVSHVILLRKQICSLFHSMKKRLRQRPAPKGEIISVVPFEGLILQGVVWLLESLLNSDVSC